MFVYIKETLMPPQYPGKAEPASVQMLRDLAFVCETPINLLAAVVNTAAFSGVLVPIPGRKVPDGYACR